MYPDGHRHVMAIVMHRPEFIYAGASAEPPPAKEVAEHGQFETWARFNAMNLERNQFGGYFDNVTHWAWIAWHKRAGQPPP